MKNVTEKVLNVYLRLEGPVSTELERSQLGCWKKLGDVWPLNQVLTSWGKVAVEEFGSANSGSSAHIDSSGGVKSCQP